MTPRSWLFVPADDAARLDKAAGRGADALIIDLEDGVTPSAKAAARVNLRNYLNENAPRLREVGAPKIWVRINPTPELFQADLDAALVPGLSGIVLAKAERPQQVSMVVNRIQQSGLPDVGLMPLIETGLAVFSVADIAAVPGVTHLQVGEADLRADLGVTFGREESELTVVRQRVVIVCAALGLPAPIAPVSVEFRDLDLFAESTRRLARMGYVGRSCIHPAQVGIVNALFTPSEDELAAAARLVAQADAAAATGQGAFVDDAGRMVDEAIVRSARRTLEMGMR